ncbi:hypothetical protein [Crenothrix sp.]
MFAITANTSATLAVSRHVTEQASESWKNNEAELRGLYDLAGL